MITQADADISRLEHNPCPDKPTASLLRAINQPESSKSGRKTPFLARRMSTIPMHQAFAQCSTFISLSGSNGTRLQIAAESVEGLEPYPRVIRWLSRKFRNHPNLFSSPDWDLPYEQVVIIAHSELRNRALGYSALEHGALVPKALKFLEHIGHAGPSGVLQSTLSKISSFAPQIVSHYVASLAARKLVVKKRVVLTTRRTENKNKDFGSKPRRMTTYTSVIVLARFSKFIEKSNASQISSVGEGIPESILRRYPRHPDIVTDPFVFMQDLDISVLTRRIIHKLQLKGGVMAERDIKLVIKPESERPVDVSQEDFVRRRHRQFRTLRSRMVKSGLVEVVSRNCVDENGKSRGTLDCLQLKRQEPVWNEESLDTPLKRPTSRSNNSASPNFNVLQEVDLLQRVYNEIRASGSNGTTVQDLMEHFDGGTGMFGITQKRIKGLIIGLGREVKIIRSRKLRGKSVVLHVTLAEFANSNSLMPADGMKRSNTKNPENLPAQVSTGRGKILKGNLTALGIERMNMVLGLLHEKKAILVETLGRTIASLEGNGLVRIDSKVMKRILTQIKQDKLGKIFTTIKPSANRTKKPQEAEILALPNLTIESREVKNVLVAVVKEGLYGKTKKRTKKNESKSCETLGKQSQEEHERPAKRLRHCGDNIGTREKGNLIDCNEPSRPPVKTKDMMQDEDQCQTYAEGSNMKPAQVKQKEKEVVVTSASRNTEKNRISRLRAVSYGWIKGKLARAKLFHKLLFTHVCSHLNASNIPEDLAACHSTIEVAKATKPIGKFSVHSCIMDMTVGMYAAIFGIHLEHGEQIYAILDRKICEVLDEMGPELKVGNSVRHVKNMVHLLIRLHLIIPDDKSENLSLSGAGIIRDFGRGMPAGTFPHGILFTGQPSIEAYWNEIHAFSVCPEDAFDLSFKPKNDGNGEISLWCNEVIDVYSRLTWTAGGSKSYMPSEQVQLEALLQEMSGVNVRKDAKGSIITRNFITGVLRYFTVQELICASEKVELGTKPQKDGSNKFMHLERLMLYAKYRSKNKAAIAPFEDGSNFSKPKGVQTILKISYEGLASSFSVQTRQVLVGRTKHRRRNTSTTNQKKDSRELNETEKSKKRARRDFENTANGYDSNLNDDIGEPQAKRATYHEDPEVNVEKCVDILLEIITIRSKMYCQSKNSIVIDWYVKGLFLVRKRLPRQKGVKKKNTVGMYDYRVMQNEIDRSKVTTYRNVFAYICGLAGVQAILDCLALKQALCVTKNVSDNMKPDLSVLCAKIQIEWKGLRDLLRSLVLFYESRITIQFGIKIEKQSVHEKFNDDLREKLIEEEFCLRHRTRLRKSSLSIAQKVNIIGDRYRSLLDLVKSRELRHEFLFQIEKNNDWRPVENERRITIHRDVMKNLLLAIVDEGKRGQSSHKTAKLLSQFPAKDIADARDDLVLEEAITILRGVDGVKYFQTCDTFHAESFQKDGARPLDLKALVQVESNWQEALQRDKRSETLLFSNTKLAAAIDGKPRFDSAMGIIGVIYLMFFGDKYNLQLTPILGATGTKLRKKRDANGHEERDEKEYVCLDSKFDIEKVKYYGCRRKASKSRISSSVAQERYSVELDGFVLQTLRSRKGLGASLHEILQCCKQKNYCKNGVLEALSSLVAGGSVARFAVDQKRSEWSSPHNVVFVSAGCIDTLKASSDTSASLLVDGRKSKLSKALDDLIYDIASRRPGLLVQRLVDAVMMKMGAVWERNIGDAIWHLARQGALRVEGVGKDYGGVLAKSNSRTRGWVDGSIDDVGDGQWYVEVEVPEVGCLHI